MATANNWSYKAGEKGRNRVRAYEKRSSGIIYLEYYEAGKRERVSTGHRDRQKAKQQADELAAQFGQASPEPGEPTTIGELFDRYLRERSPEVSEQRRKVHRRVAESMGRVFGREKRVQTLNRQDWDKYQRERRSGTIDARGNRVSTEDRTPVGPRAVREDLEVLRAACNWAVQADLIGTNPTDGYPLPAEKNPTRPRLSEERYRAMLEVAREVDWRFRLALILAHETGHRSKAIRRLKWSDVDLAEGLIRWRAEEDKSGHEHVTPLTDAASEALRDARGEHPGIGNRWIFPAPKKPSAPCSRNIFRDWWNRAEKMAGLDPIEGLGWHGLRRKFADELRDAPLKDVANLGGWQTEQTILRCYQGESLDAMREAQEKRERLRKRRGSA